MKKSRAADQSAARSDDRSCFRWSIQPIGQIHRRAIIAARYADSERAVREQCSARECREKPTAMSGTTMVLGLSGRFWRLLAVARTFASNSLRISQHVHDAGLSVFDSGMSR